MVRVGGVRGSDGRGGRCRGRFPMYYLENLITPVRNDTWLPPLCCWARLLYHLPSVSVSVMEFSVCVVVRKMQVEENFEV